MNYPKLWPLTFILLTKNGVDIKTKRMSLTTKNLFVSFNSILMTINSCFIYIVYICTIFIFIQVIIPLILNLGAALHYYYINFLFLESKGIEIYHLWMKNQYCTMKKNITIADSTNACATLLYYLEIIWQEIFKI